MHSSSSRTTDSAPCAGSACLSFDDGVPPRHSIAVGDLHLTQPMILGLLVGDVVHQDGKVGLAQRRRGTSLAIISRPPNFQRLKFQGSALGLTTAFMTRPISSCVASILPSSAKMVAWPNLAVRSSSASQSFSKPPRRPRSPLIKPRKRLVRQAPEPLTVPTATNHVWSMDFMHDQLADGRSIRLNGCSGRPLALAPSARSIVMRFRVALDMHFRGS